MAQPDALLCTTGIESPVAKTERGIVGPTTEE